MNWFRENRFLAAFLLLAGAGMIAAGGFLLSAGGDWADAVGRFDLATAELNRLERLAPFPSEENLRKMKAEAKDYAGALERLTGELRTHGVPLESMAPNEFQSRLRLAVTGVVDRARANNIKLPDKFHLGFDEFASALPSEAAAPLLGRELVQIEWLFDTLFEARVDALTSFHRMPLAEEHGAASVPALTAGKKAKAMAGPAVLERNVVEATIVSTPAAARKVLNKIAGSNEQFFVVRLLHVRNEKDKGPPREAGAEAVVAASPSVPTDSPATKSAGRGSLNFIVGNERIETSMKIEIVRFTL